MEKTIIFGIEQVKEYAKFVAQLVREGVSFEMRASETSLSVTLTGAF